MWVWPLSLPLKIGSSTLSESAGPTLRVRLAFIAATAAFVFHVAVRVRSIELGYQLGRKHAEVARLREVKRVLELERSAHETPERIDLISDFLKPCQLALVRVKYLF